MKLLKLVPQDTNIKFLKLRVPFFIGSLLLMGTLVYHFPDLVYGVMAPDQVGELVDLTDVEAVGDVVGLVLQVVEVDVVGEGAAPQDFGECGDRHCLAEVGVVTGLPPSKTALAVSPLLMIS